jgi:hypothetical protein
VTTGPQFVTDVAKFRDLGRTGDRPLSLIAYRLQLTASVASGLSALASLAIFARPRTRAATADGMYTVSFASAGGAAKVGSEMLLYAAS